MILALFTPLFKQQLAQGPSRVVYQGPQDSVISLSRLIDLFGMPLHLFPSSQSSSRGKMLLLKIKHFTLPVLGFERAQAQLCFRRCWNSDGNSLDVLSWTKQCLQGQRGGRRSVWFCIIFQKQFRCRDVSLFIPAPGIRSQHFLFSFHSCTRSQITTLSVPLSQFRSYLRKATVLAVPFVGITEPCIQWPSAVTKLHGRYFPCQAGSFPRLLCPYPRSRQ